MISDPPAQHTCHHGHTDGACWQHAANGQHIDRRAFVKQSALASMGVVFACGVGGCAQNAATGRSSMTFTSMQDDIQTGRKAHKAILQQYGGAYENHRLNRYVTAVGHRLAVLTENPRLSYTFTVLNTDVVNAFALPGGYVYITRGLLALASNEAEMAGILGHELGHVNARHSAERQSQNMILGLGAMALDFAGAGGLATSALQMGGGLFLQSYSRQQEMEADTLGERYISRAKYDPNAMVTMLETLREHSQVLAKMAGRSPDSVDEFNIMASHPRTIDRVEAVLQKAQASMVTNGKVARQPYLQQVSGMIYGTDPQEGVFQGQTFLHPKMRIAFTFPQDFKLVNETDHVGGTHSNGSVIVFDVARNLAGGSTMDYLEYDWLKGQPLRDLQTISVNGLAAATGWRQVGSNGETYDARLVAIQGAGDRIYRFIFATPPRLTQALSDSFKRMTYSFRTITDREAAAVVPRTLATHVVTARDTIASLSQNMPHGEYNATMFRVLNDLGETDRLRVGQVVKVVV